MSERLPSLRFLSRHTITIAALVVTLTTAAYADLPTRLRNVPAAGCYCHCHEALARRGCTKMCDAKKGAVQWLATTCMKPHFRPPADKSGAGPRLRHRDHAEHAQLLR